MKRTRPRAPDVQVEAFVYERGESAQRGDARTTQLFLVQDQEDSQGRYSSAALRPPVSVVIPFAGSADDARQVVERFARLRLAESDEIVVGDNSVDQVFATLDLPPSWHAAPAIGEGSPARGRNAGAAAARGDWVLFIDSDCVPEPDLIDAYFADPPPDDTPIVAGRVAPLQDQRSAAAEHAATRGRLDQRYPLDKDEWRWAYTANLLVRRDVWRELGGFLEGIRNAEDVDFCWRAEKAGWKLLYNDKAAVEHAHRESFADMWRQSVIAGASEHWVHRRWPQAPRPRRHTLRELGRALIGAPAFLLRGQRRRALLKVYDGVLALAPTASRVRSNRAIERALPDAGTRPPLQLWVDSFPVVSETFVTNEARALRDLGHPVTIVATRRPERPAIGVHDLPVRYLEDYTGAERLRALCRLVARHPVRSAADMVLRQGWRREEQVPPLRELAPAIVALERSAARVHAHFAAGAALAALRAGRITRRGWSLTAHAYDIWQHPRNLEPKLRAARVVTTGCDYNVRELKRLGAADVHEIVMGVDPERFRRKRPHESTRTVVAVGRLVEKKGFTHLIAAAAAPELAGARIVIAGDGPLRGQLEAAAGDNVEFTGRLEPAEVRELIETADVLAMPSVIAHDGDRDSMPVVVKEALALEVPVVASDEVGLPEIVRPEFGRLVPPGDARALAATLAEVLGMTAEQRAAMGRAGREFVAEHANVSTETEKLSRLLT